MVKTLVIGLIRFINRCWLHTLMFSFFRMVVNVGCIQSLEILPLLHIIKENGESIKELDVHFSQMFNITPGMLSASGVLFFFHILIICEKLI